MALSPRKQTLVIFIVCAFAVGGTALYSFDGEKSRGDTPATNEEISTLPADYSDTLNSDWREQFLDSVSGFTAPTQTASVQAPAGELTATDKLGRSFFGKYIELRQRGALESEAAVSDAIEESLSEAASSVSMPKVYSLTDISVTNDSSASLNSYNLVIMTTLREYSSKKDEALIALEAFEKQDVAVLSKIDPIIKQYENILSGLITTKVPQSLASKHLDLINGLSAGLYGARSFREIDNDPLQALVGIRLNIAAEQAISAAFISIQASLASVSQPISS